MASAIHDIAIEIGSDFIISFEYLDIENNPVNLDGYCVSMLMKPTTGSGKAVGFSSQNSSTSVINNGWTLLTNNNNITLSITSAFIYTNMLEWEEGVYDLYITELSTPEKKSRLSTGIITIIRNNFPECALVSCGNEQDCVDLLQPAPDPSPTVPDIEVTPTPTPSIPVSDIDLCSLFCNDLEINAVMYTGSGLNIVDNSMVSGSIQIDDTRTVQNIELMINKLKHSYPQDLAMILVPPTGDKILLSAHNKINNNNSYNGFSYIFSNKAVPGIYINNVTNNTSNIPYVNILDKTNFYNFNNEPLSSSLSSWIGTTPSGEWTLIVKDDDIGTSGTIEDWRLIITYEPPPLTVDPI